MVMLNDVVEVFDLDNLDQPEPAVEQQQPVHMLQSGKVGAALVYDNFLRPAIIAYSESKEGTGCSLVTMLRQHEIKDSAMFINRSVEIGPFALDLDVRLVHSPRAAGR